MIRLVRALLTGASLAVGFLIGCEDKGTGLPPSKPPVISSVTPSSFAVGDTVRINGSDFGGTQGSGSLTIGSRVICTVLNWSPTEIRVRIPGGTFSGAVRARVGGQQSNSITVNVSGGFAGQMSFACDIQPIILANCAVAGCHSGSQPTSQFNQSTYAGMRSGGVNYGTSVIIPGDSTNSGIMKELRGTGIVGRMPFGGQFQATGLPDTMIVMIGRWIVQGAMNN